jgi:hypothetical protein
MVPQAETPHLEHWSLRMEAGLAQGVRHPAVPLLAVVVVVLVFLSGLMPQEQQVEIAS